MKDMIERLSRLAGSIDDNIELRSELMELIKIMIEVDEEVERLYEALE